MLALIPYPFTDPKFSIDADSMRMVSRLTCHLVGARGCFDQPART